MDPQFKAVDGNIGSGRFIIGHNDPNLSNEEVVLDITAVVIPEGTPMGKRSRGAQAVAVPVAGGGNAGNGAFAAQPTGDAGVDPGDYSILFIEPVNDAGTFEVRRPDGALDGVGNVGVAYNGRINFTLNDGANNFAAGDSFMIAVSYAAGNGRWQPVAKAIADGATDGSQVATGLLYHRAPISVATQKNVVVARHQPVNGFLCNFAGLNGGQKATVEAQLAQQNIIVRY